LEVRDAADFERGATGPARGGAGFFGRVLKALAWLMWLGCADPAHAATVTAMEYYIETDPGKGLATPVPPLDGACDSTGETGQVSVATSSLKGTSGNRRLRLEYLRRKNIDSIIYRVFFASALSPLANWQPATGSETVTSIDSIWERVSIDDAAATGSEAGRFGTVQVTLQP